MNYDNVPNNQRWNYYLYIKAKKILMVSCYETIIVRIVVKLKVTNKFNYVHLVISYTD